MNRLTRRTLADALGRHLIRTMPSSRVEWAIGMKAEISAIDDPRAALLFALGCVRVGYVRRLRTVPGVLAVMRGLVAVLTLTFAVLVLCNAGLALTLDRPESLPPVLGGLGLAYMIAGLTLIRNGPGHLAGAAIVMLAVNSLALWAMGRAVVLYADFYRAMVLEGYLLWSLLLVAGLTLYFAGRSTRLAAFAQGHGWNG